MVPYTYRPPHISLDVRSISAQPALRYEPWLRGLALLLLLLLLSPRIATGCVLYRHAPATSTGELRRLPRCHESRPRRTPDPQIHLRAQLHSASACKTLTPRLTCFIARPLRNLCSIHTHETDRIQLRKSAASRAQVNMPPEVPLRTCHSTTGCVALSLYRSNAIASTSTCRVLRTTSFSMSTAIVDCSFAENGHVLRQSSKSYFLSDQAVWWESGWSRQGQLRDYYTPRLLHHTCFMNVRLRITHGIESNFL
jgi:hypothetical protein